MPTREILKRAMPPSHPGELLEEVLLEHLNLSVTKAADILQTSRQHLHRILKGASPVTADMAVKIGKLGGNGPALWMNMQMAYDLWYAERRMADVLKHIPTARELADA